MDTEDIKRFIERHVDRLDGIETLAKELDLPPEKLRKTFRRAEGIPISQFIVMTRVENAKSLLRNTGKYCYEICFEVGFPRQDGGARTFKRITGMTMEEYRKACRSEMRRASHQVRRDRRETMSNAFCPA